MTWDDPYRTGWTKAPPVMVDGQSERDFENVLYAFFAEQNEIRRQRITTEYFAGMPLERIKDEERGTKLDKRGRAELTTEYNTGA